MNKLKTYYVTNPNMGDHLNVLIMEKVFGYTPIRRTPINCDISGIGSGLGKFCYADSKWLNFLEHLTGKIWPKTYVWGTGFIEYRVVDKPFFRKNMIFCAVRGELSKQRVEKILGHTLGNIPTCDGGILASNLIDEVVTKKYNLGIVPHISEQRRPEFLDLKSRFDKSIIIDLLDDPYKVVKNIAECKYILSSSLHGLIVADSFHIPNLHIKITDNMQGDGFKFDDYYSGYGIVHKQYKINDIKNLEFILEHYELDFDEIERKKQQMLDCFPFPKIDVL